MKNKFLRQLIEVEIRLGFLSIPSHGIELMPDTKGKIRAVVDGDKRELSYNPEHRRIFGLTSWYKKLKAKPKDQVELIKKSDNSYEIKFVTEEVVKKKEEKQDEEILDLSGLSTQAKGDIVEDRIKELVLLHGQGLLNVYKPVSDTEGIDLIVVKNGQFHPIFIQVKGRYGLHQGRSLLLRVKKKTFTAHDSFYVVGAFFNPRTLELEDKIVLIPSKKVIGDAGIVNSKGEWYNIVASLKETSNDKWSKYKIKKEELATKLIEKFEEMHRYIK